MKKKQKFPKRAKLITDGGFAKIVGIDEFVMQIHYPLIKRITLATPETGEVDLQMSFDCEFQFERATKTLAYYRQVNVTSVVK